MNTLFGIALVVLVSAFAFGAGAMYVSRRYISLVQPAVLNILLEKERINLQELCRLTRERLESKKDVHWFFWLIAPQPLHGIYRMEQMGWIVREEVMRTDDSKSWGTYKIYTLTDKGKAIAENLNKLNVP